MLVKGTQVISANSRHGDIRHVDCVVNLNSMKQVTLCNYHFWSSTLLTYNTAYKTRVHVSKKRVNFVLHWQKNIRTLAGLREWVAWLCQNYDEDARFSEKMISYVWRGYRLQWQYGWYKMYGKGIDFSDSMTHFRCMARYWILCQ